MARTSSRGALGAILLVSSTLAVLSPVQVALSLPLNGTGAGDLSVDFHAASCPQLEGIVRSNMQAALSTDITIAAGLLRIFFHDCFPQGCDASLLLMGGNSEQRLGQNSFLHPGALQLIEQIRAHVHAVCGPIVTCADITALATRDAVCLSGGPCYAVRLGQLDSFAPAPDQFVLQLPSPATGDVSQLGSAFASRGLGDPADLVVLSGAHTIGRAHCSSFSDRASRQEDPFSRDLFAVCALNPNLPQFLDLRTPNLFDNSYYVNLVSSQGVFTSDMALVRDVRTSPIVLLYAQNQDAFFAQFARSMVKLSLVPKPAGNVGEIRQFSCFRTNLGGVADADADASGGSAASA